MCVCVCSLARVCVRVRVHVRACTDIVYSLYSSVCAVAACTPPPPSLRARQVFLRLAADVEHESQAPAGAAAGTRGGKDKDEGGIADLRALGGVTRQHSASSLSGPMPAHASVDVPSAAGGKALADLFVPTDLALRPASMTEQFKAQLWRNFRQARRDKRAVFLQVWCGCARA